MLGRFPGERFRVFPDPGSDFTDALLGCRGVIAPAGHQLLSESLYLGKPVLAIPQLGHFEQRLNAGMLRLSGRGRQGRIRTLEKDLSRFIEEIDSFPRAGASFEPFCFTDDTRRAVSLIDQFVREQRRFLVLPRQQYSWFLTIPEKIEVLRAIATRRSA